MFRSLTIHTLFYLCFFAGGTGKQKRKFGQKRELFTGSRYLYHVICNFYNNFHGWVSPEAFTEIFSSLITASLFMQIVKREREENQGKNTASTCTLCVCLSIYWLNDAIWNLFPLDFLRLCLSQHILVARTYNSSYL